jgi:hypothetical protein
MDNEQQSFNEGYFIIRDAHLIDKAKTYDEAIKKGKRLKRSVPQSKLYLMALQRRYQSGGHKQNDSERFRSESLVATEAYVRLRCCPP